MKWQIGVALLLGSLVAIICALAIFFGPDDARVLFSDPAATTGETFYIGAFSALGISALISSAALSAFTALELRKMDEEKDSVRMFGALAALMAVLAIDDQLMLHEHVGPERWGIRQRLFMLLYAALAALIALRYGRRLAKVGPVLLLLAAFGSLAVSALCDMVSDHFVLKSEALGVGEDIAKLYGAVLMLAAIWISCGRALRSPGGIPLIASDDLGFASDRARLPTAPIVDIAPANAD